MGLYKKLNVSISDNLEFVAIHFSIHVLHFSIHVLQIVGDQEENALPYA